LTAAENPRTAARRIEDLALIGNAHSAALVGRDGTIEWLCLPRFDSPALFASLLGSDQNGSWRLAASDPAARRSRRYRPGTGILETTFRTATGRATVIDFMPVPENENQIDLIRMVRCDAGAIDMVAEIRFRFDYGRTLPWLRRHERGITAIAGPDGVLLSTAVELENRDFATVAKFHISAGETRSFALTWFPSHREVPRPRDPAALLEETETRWRRWVAQMDYDGLWRAQVERSLITLKALTYHPTGGIVAAPTTSLPEQIGGPRNWDYRYCWLRDSTVTLYALVSSGFRDEAVAWRSWLLRAAAGSPEALQIMYSIKGGRRLTEQELDWLPGFCGSRPVRIGNQAHLQLQLDVFGEVFDSFHAARRYGIDPSDDQYWALQKVLVDYLERIWHEADEGIWEIRGEPRHFVHSKVMAWVAVDRAIKSAEEFGLNGPIERWHLLRDRIHADVCANGFDAGLGSFVQYYGGQALDAALLLLVHVGFLPPEDPRIRGTIAAIERTLLRDGLVYRYSTASAVDGLPGGEGAFLACSFWLCDAYALSGRYDEARRLFERLLGLTNDVGLLSEEYDPVRRRQLGNFPQAFSHVALINTAHALTNSAGAAHQRASRAPKPRPAKRRRSGENPWTQNRPNRS
jgi:GH15 family glucan-1,4-alpha-glucosidase